MQPGEMSTGSLPVGNAGALISGAPAASSVLGKGAVPASVPASAVQGIFSSASKAGASTSGTLVVSLPSLGGAGMTTPAFQASSNVAQAGASTSGFQGAVTPVRQRFHIELKEGETNVVSWKKLVKEAKKNEVPAAAEVPAGANPALEARLVPEHAGLPQANMAAGQEPLQPPKSRFSSVIEKIERLYQGVDSEEEDEYVSLDEDQYDSEDDFIDDSELNEYFSTGGKKAKHTGFYVNRGKLETVTESQTSSPPPSPPPMHVPKKRKRNSSKLSSEILAGEFAKKRVNIGLRLKDAARKTPGPTMSTAEPGLVASSSKPSEHSPGDKPQKRVKPILDDRGTVEPPARQVADRFSKENARPTTNEAVEGRDATGAVQTGLLELSDDETDLEVVLRPEFDVKDGSSSDLVPSNKQATPLVSDGSDNSNDERSVASRPIKASSVEVVSKSDPDEVGEMVGTAVLPKARKNQQQPIKEEDPRDADGGGKPSSTPLTLSPGTKEVSPKRVAGWPKGTVLERAIHDLEKEVAEALPLTGDRQEAIEYVESGGKSKRLPREVKQKLAKVARLAARKGKITDDLVDRLMNIIGHVMRVKTLRRNLKAMVEMGLSAKQEKEARLQDIKSEVKMLVNAKLRAQYVAEQQDTSSDDFQAPPGSAGRAWRASKFKWDDAIEDLLYGYYDLYIEGMDEHRGPQIRKLYVELTDLWPAGGMDNIGVKNAIYRARERRKKQNKLKMGEERRRKKAALAAEKQRSERENVLVEKQGTTGLTSASASASASTYVPLLIKEPTQKEKLVVKSTKQRIENSSKQWDDDQSEDIDEEQQIHTQEARRLALEGAMRHGMEFPRKHLANSGKTREQSTSESNVEYRHGLTTDDKAKVHRNDDGVVVKRKIPRKNFEGRIIERLGRKRSKTERVENESLESLRSSKNPLLNSPLIKAAKIRKVRPSNSINPSPGKSLNSQNRLVNGGSSSQSAMYHADSAAFRDQA